MPIHTVPTGFDGVPPDGPAIPVVDSPMSVRAAPRIPDAIDSAVSLLTAPCAPITPAGTRRSSVFEASLYVTTPRSKYAELPLTFVSLCAMSPPVHDSATAIVSFLSASMPPRTVSRSSSSVP